VDRRDALLAGSLLTAGIVEAVLAVATERPAALALVPALALPLAYRRSRPATVALAVSVALAVQGPFTEIALFEQTFVGYLCLLIATYSLGRHAGGRTVVVAGGGCALVVAGLIGISDGSAASAAIAAGLTLAPAAGGRVVRDRARLVEVLESEARALDAGRRLQAEVAAGHERDRVSRELHDIVSHSIGEMVVQAHAARMLATRDPRHAPAAIEVLESTGTSALAEMRRLLGVLRRGDEALALAPSPSLSRLGALIDRMGADGRAIELVVEGEPVKLPPGLEVAAYRIVEQALGAAGAGNRDATRVRVRYGRRVLQLETVTEGCGNSSPPHAEHAGQPQPPALERRGAGTVGIAERVRAFGGELRVAPTRNGGQVMRVRLPLNGSPRAARTSPDRPRRGAESRARSGERYRSAGRARAGALGVAVLLAAAAVEIALSPAREGPLWANGLMSTLITAPLLARRAFPPAAVGLSFAAATAMCALLTPVSEVAALTVVLLLLYPYACGAHGGTRSAWAGLCLALGGVLAIDVAQQTLGWGDLVFPALLVSLSWLAGRIVRARADMAREVAERAQGLEQLRDEQAVAMAQAERRRIARELHDVVAHTLSVMVVQAGGARWTLEREPARAAAALKIVEETGRAALRELRRLLWVLDCDQQQPLTPQPGLGELAALVEQARGAGLSVELEFGGRPRAVPEGLQLAAYRIVQEALTNTRRHAGGASARVSVRYTATSLTLEITDDGQGSRRKGPDGQPGHGLAGMRERVAAYGGEFSVGPQDDGGFAVRAEFPLGERWSSANEAPIAGGPAITAPATEKEVV